MRDQVSAGKCVAVEQMGDYRLNGLYSRARRAHTFWFHAGSGLALRHVMHETKIDCEGKRMAEKAGSARDGGMGGKEERSERVGICCRKQTSREGEKRAHSGDCGE